jgi:hypothetical protein
LTNDWRESNANIRVQATGKTAEIGGPGRTRTSNQTVMSGGTKTAGFDFPDDSTRSIVFVAFRCDRFWCETGAVIAVCLRLREAPANAFAI